jgi:hypothetical protein
MGCRMGLKTHSRKARTTKKNLNGGIGLKNLFAFTRPECRRRASSGRAKSLKTTFVLLGAGRSGPVENPPGLVCIASRFS